MSMKSVVVAVLLIALGIVFGVTLVSTFKGVDLSFAGEDVSLGAQSKPAPANPTLQALNDAFHNIAKNVTPTIVYIRVVSNPSSDTRSNRVPFFHFFGPDIRQAPEIGVGSGVILTPDGYILTNNHVVENASKGGIDVTLSDNRVFRKAKLIGTDKFTDLAVIKIDAKDLPVPRLGNSDDVEVGHIVFAFGNPLNLASTMTEGIVSALGRQLNIIDAGATGLANEDFIQTDAAVNPGNSGGALVNINGEVIGINAAIATTNARYQGYSFAIPMNLARRVAGDIIKYGKYRRGYIGVEINTVDATMAKANGLDKPMGVFVQRITSGGAGEAAGLKAGDIILSVDGKEVSTSNQLQTMIASKYPGDIVTLKLYRDGKTIEKKVTLKGRDTENELVSAQQEGDDQSPSEEESASPKSVQIESLGMSIRNLDEKTKEKYDVQNGVIVQSVEPFGEAASRFLQPSDVIVSVGDQPVSSTGDFERILKGKKAGDAVLLRVKQADKTMKFVAIEVPGK
jgi:serine protease Do